MLTKPFVVLRCVFLSNCCHAMVNLIWSPADIGGVHTERAALFVPVQLQGCDRLQKYYVYMQLDTGQSQTVLYRQGVNEVLAVCPLLKQKLTLTHAKLPIVMDELLHGEPLPLYGTPNDGPIAPVQSRAIVLGSIGIDLLESAYLYIDANAQKLMLTKNLGKFLKATTQLQFKSVSLDGWQRMIVPLAIQGRVEPIALMLDTGTASQNIVVSPEFVATLSGEQFVSDVKRNFELSGWGHSYPCKEYEMNSVPSVFGVLLKSRAIVRCDGRGNAAGLGAVDSNGLLGLGGLGSRFKLAINMPSKLVAIETRDSQTKSRAQIGQKRKLSEKKK